MIEIRGKIEDDFDKVLDLFLGTSVFPISINILL